MTFKSVEEQILYYTLLLTWVWYFLGAMYVVPPVVGWLLLGLWLKRIIAGEPTRPVPPIVMVWICAMLVMEVALIAGHVNWDLGAALTIKSTVGWMKGWALFAIFALIGGCMTVRVEVLAKAATLLAIQTLCLIPIFVLAPMIGAPGTLYYSPLMALGGPGPEYFEVQLYGSGFDGGTRWRFFAPWAPAAAVALGMLTPLILRHRSSAQIGLALLAVILAVIMTKSRLGLLSTPLCLLIAAAIARITNPRIFFSLAALAFVFSLLGDTLINFIAEQKEQLGQMRADSTYVREVLARIALYRWETEAPIFGHGVVEAGPPIVEFMPIGSHHSWYGLLFVKGIVGLFALLVPLLATICALSIRAIKSRDARAALGIMVFFCFTTFTENVEMLAYLMWPGFVVAGAAVSRRIYHPMREPMNARQAAPSMRIDQFA